MLEGVYQTEGVRERGGEGEVSSIRISRKGVSHEVSSLRQSSYIGTS